MTVYKIVNTKTKEKAIRYLYSNKAKALYECKLLNFNYIFCTEKILYKIEKVEINIFQYIWKTIKGDLI